MQDLSYRVKPRNGRQRDGMRLINSIEPCLECSQEGTQEELSWDTGGPDLSFFWVNSGWGCISQASGCIQTTLVVPPLDDGWRRKHCIAILVMPVAWTCTKARRSATGSSTVSTVSELFICRCTTCVDLNECSHYHWATRLPVREP